MAEAYQEQSVDFLLGGKSPLVAKLIELGQFLHLEATLKGLALCALNPLDTDPKIRPRSSREFIQGM
jgi:hypothetical protein